MECINHPGMNAAGTCQLCGKALCASCMNRFNPPLCEACLISHNGAIERKLYLDLAITGVIFVGTLILLMLKTEANYEGGISISLMIAGAYWGWQFINKIPMPIILTSGLGWILYLIIKFWISVFAGFIIAPWEIFKRIKEIREISSLRQKIRAGQA